jgi:hypothetical protein
VPDVVSVVSAANAFAADHPNVALVSFAINLATGLTLLANRLTLFIEKILALDLRLIDHRAERRRRLGKIPRRSVRPRRQRSTTARRSQTSFATTNGRNEFCHRADGPHER